MKITNYSLLTAAVVAISLVTIVQAAPSKKNVKPDVSTLNHSDLYEINECIWRNETPDNSSFCRRVLNPDHENSFFWNNSPKERTMRYVFFTEAAELWRLYKEWSLCQLRTHENNVGCEYLLRETEYKGSLLHTFPRDLKYFYSYFWAYWAKFNPHVHLAKHCLLFHSNSSYLPHYAKKCKEYSNINGDNILGTYPMLSYYFPKWRFQAYTRHGIALQPSNDSERAELQREEASYNCLYYPSFRKSDDLKEFCQSVVTNETMSKAFSFNSISDEYLQGFNQSQKHFVKFVRANYIFDCLRYHRHEKLPGCEDVFKYVLFLKYAGRKDPLVEMSIRRVQEEEKQDAFAVKEASQLRAFIVLAVRLPKLCQFHTPEGWLAKHPPKDCKEGGLYYPFL